MNKTYSRFLFHLLFLWSSAAVAQTVEPTTQELVRPFRSNVVRSAQAQGMVYGQAELGSNFALPSLLWNSTWNTSLVDEQVNRLNSGRATFGYVLEGGFEYLMKENAKGRRYWFALGHQANLGVRTTSDAVRLFLKGNAPYKGESLKLGQTSLEYSQYTFAKVGFLKNTGNSSFSGGVGLYLGSNKGGINAEKLSLFTDDLGRYVALNGSLDRHVALQNGPGLGVDFGYSLEKRNSQIHLCAENIGLVLYRNVKLQETQGEEVNFEGVRINSLRDELVFNQIEDSLENEFLTEDTSSILYVLPFSVHAQGYHGLKNNNGIGWEFRYRYISGFMPAVSAFYQINFPKGNALRLGAEMGGFGYFGTHLGADIRLGSNVLIQVQATGGDNLAYSSARARFGGQLGLVFRPE
jgi:hypothetical protein